MKVSLKWLVPSAAVLVPAILIFRWAHELDKGAAAAVRGTPKPPPGAMTPGPPPPKGHVAGTAAAAVAAAVKEGPPAVSTAAVVSQSTAPVSAAPAVAASTSAAHEVSSLTAGEDPMMSPSDLASIAEEEARKRKALEDAEKAKHAPKPQAKAAPKPPDPETLIHVEGIISNDSGYKAIVNGEMAAVGDKVLGVTIVEIVANRVVFRLGKKKFTKSVVGFSGE